MNTIASPSVNHSVKTPSRSKGISLDGVQRKLKVGKADDKYEKEADNVADKVIRMPAMVKPSVPVSSIKQVQFKAISAPISEVIFKKAEDKDEQKPDILKMGVQKQEEERDEPAQPKTIQKQEEDKEESAQTKNIQKQEEEREEPIQAKTIQKQDEEQEESVQPKRLQKQEESTEEKEDSPLQTKGDEGSTLADRVGAASIESKLSASKGSGSPLADETRSSMEQGIGADFSKVRVHTGANAIQMSKNLNAQAFTHGRDIYFNQGKYQPETNSGRKLLAHELTHTIQQGAVVRKKASVSTVGGPRVQRLSLTGIIDSLLEFVPGYSLIKVMIGRNPITLEPVPRTGINLLKGVLGLIPVLGHMLFLKLRQTGTIQKAGEWLDIELEKLAITWSYIKSLIATAWDRMSIWKGISGNLQVIKEVFGPPWRRIVNFLSAVKFKIKEIIVEGALRLAGSAGGQVLGILKQSRVAFMKVVDDPIGFIKNFFKAIGMGFNLFKTNFLTHLKRAIFEWLFGAISEAGIQLPEKWDLKGVFSLIMQILGLTYNNIRAKVVKRLGPKGEQIVSTIEKSVAFIKDLIVRGPIVLWEMAKEKLANLKEMIFAPLSAWVTKTIVKSAVGKLLSMLNPAGALIQLAITIYKTVMFFIENWQRISDLVNTIFGSMAQVALGKLGAAAAFVEKAMGKGLTLVIKFLARLIGLGGIAKEIQKILLIIRKPFDKVIDKVVGVVVRLGLKMMKFGKSVVSKGKDMLKKGVMKGKEKVKSLVEWWKIKMGFKTKSGEKHSLYFKGKGPSAALYIASSDPKEIKQKLQQLKNDNIDNQKVIRLYNQAIKEYNRLYSLKKSIKPDSAKARIEVNQLRNQMSTLNKLIKDIFDAIDPVSDIPSSTINFGSLNNEFGNFARANPLTKILSEKGSETKQSALNKNPHWRDLLYRRTSSGKSSYYIAGHLMNADLGGPGDNWKNLTPLTRKANSDHYHKVEKRVKDFVFIGKAGGKSSAGKNKKPSVLRYFVKANYGSGHQGITDNHIKKAKSKDKVERLRQVEKFVPTHLQCEVDFYPNYQFERSKKERVLSETIDNKPDNSYKFDD